MTFGAGSVGSFLSAYGMIGYFEGKSDREACRNIVVEWAVQSGSKGERNHSSWNCTCERAGVGAGGLVGAGAAAAFGAKKEVPKDEINGSSGAYVGDGHFDAAAKDMTPSEQKAATKIAGNHSRT